MVKRILKVVGIMLKMTSAEQDKAVTIMEIMLDSFTDRKKEESRT